MKKALSLLLALAMALSLAACGSTTQENPADTTETESQETTEPLELVVFAAAA